MTNVLKPETFDRLDRYHTPWLGSLIPYFLLENPNRDSWHFSFPRGLCKYFIIHFLKVDITKTRFVSFNVCIRISSSKVLSTFFVMFTLNC